MTKLIVLLLVLLSESYSIFLNIVRYRSGKNPIPENLSDVYDKETYGKWRSYSAEHTRLAIISGIASLIITIILLSANAYAAFASIFHGSLFWQTFSIVLFAVLASSVIEVFRSYAGTMIIEEKYGFNRSSLKTFIFDSIRQLLVSFLLSFALSFLILGLHLAVGDWLILLFGLVTFAGIMLISFIYLILSRIGNKFIPLEDSELRERLMALLEKYGYKVKEIEVMDASRRTTKTNAYFTGFGKLKTIVLYDNLLNSMTPDEICAVFAHEMGHGLNKDVLKSQTLNIFYTLLIGVMIFVTLKIPSLYTSFGFEGINYGFAFVLIGVWLGLLQPITSLVINAISRRHEYRADRQAVKEGLGEPMISALKKLSRHNFAHLAPSPVNVVLEYSHPPMSARIAAIEKGIKDFEELFVENHQIKSEKS